MLSFNLGARADLVRPVESACSVDGVFSASVYMTLLAKPIVTGPTYDSPLESQMASGESSPSAGPHGIPWSNLNQLDPSGNGWVLKRADCTVHSSSLHNMV